MGIGTKLKRKRPQIPKHYFSRPHVPPPMVHNGKVENKKHYDYKIFLGETLRDRLPYLEIDYEYTELPSFWHERYRRFLNYTPDIFIRFADDEAKILHYCDVEVNGLVHYKNRDQILKVKERKDHIYPYLEIKKEPDKKDYATIASYIIIEVDHFELEPISDIYGLVKTGILCGGLYPKNLDDILTAYLKVAF